MPAPASFKGGTRPYLVVSNETRPYYGEEYTVSVITTRERDDAVALGPDCFIEGRLLEYPSYVNPWLLHVFRHEDIDRRVAQVSSSVSQTVADRCYDFVRPR